MSEMPELSGVNPFSDQFPHRPGRAAGFFENQRDEKSNLAFLRETGCTRKLARNAAKAVDDKMSEHAADKEKRRQGCPRTFDKSRVLDLACETYSTGNPADVLINAICKRAEVSKPAMYREFGNQDGLTEVAVEDYTECVLVRGSGIVKREAGCSDTLEALIGFVALDPGFETGVFSKKGAPRGDSLVRKGKPASPRSLRRPRRPISTCCDAAWITHPGRATCQSNWLHDILMNKSAWRWRKERLMKIPKQLRP